MKTLEDYINLDLMNWFVANNLKYKIVNIKIDKGLLIIINAGQTSIEFPELRQCRPLDRNSCGSIKHSFQASAHLFLIQKFLVRQQS